MGHPYSTRLDMRLNDCDNNTPININYSITNIVMLIIAYTHVVVTVIAIESELTGNICIAVSERYEYDQHQQ